MAGHSGRNSRQGPRRGWAVDQFRTGGWIVRHRLVAGGRVGARAPRFIWWGVVERRDDRKLVLLQRRSARVAGTDDLHQTGPVHGHYGVLCPLSLSLVALFFSFTISGRDYDPMPGDVTGKARPRKGKKGQIYNRVSTSSWATGPDGGRLQIPTSSRRANNSFWASTRPCPFWSGLRLPTGGSNSGTPRTRLLEDAGNTSAGRSGPRSSNGVEASILWILPCHRPTAAFHIMLRVAADPACRSRRSPPSKLRLVAYADLPQLDPRLERPGQVSLPARGSPTRFSDRK